MSTLAVPTLLCICTFRRRGPSCNHATGAARTICSGRTYSFFPGAMRLLSFPRRAPRASWDRTTPCTRQASLARASAQRAGASLPESLQLSHPSDGARLQLRSLTFSYAGPARRQPPSLQLLVSVAVTVLLAALCRSHASQAPSRTPRISRGLLNAPSALRAAAV